MNNQSSKKEGGNSTSDKLDNDNDFEIYKKHGNWVEFEFTDYVGEAKIFEETKDNGIIGDVSDGHINKLTIRSGNGDLVFSYDCNLEINFVNSKVLARILRELESYAKNQL